MKKNYNLSFKQCQTIKHIYIMKRTQLKIIAILSFLIAICLQNPLYSVTRVSAQSGNFYNQNTWVGGFYPAFGDDIVISSGHTVRLDAAGAFVRNITIEVGATLVNGAFDLTILTTQVENPVYTNNGVQNGPGHLIAYEYYDTEVTGSGVTNCTIEIVSYGLRVLGSCSLTINGNVQHSANTSQSMNGKYFIDNSQGGSLTINGDIITTPLYAIGIQNALGNLTINGNVFLYGGSMVGAGSTLENMSVLNISGNLLLGDNLGYAWNHDNGVISIGGDLLGSGAGVTYFFQDANSTVRFGGSVFPASNDGDLCVAGAGAEPNIVEYNGGNNQVIKAPSDGATLGLGYTLNTYSNLVINNSSVSGVTINSDLTVNGILTLTDGLVNLESNNLMLAENASVAGTPSADKMVVATSSGEMRKAFISTGSFVFPVGDNEVTADYSPVTVNFSTGTFNSGYVAVNLSNQAYPGVSGSYLDRYWNVNSSGIKDFTCTTQFDYVPDDVVGSESLLYCFRMTPTINQFDTTNVTLHQLTANGLTSFGTFTGKQKDLLNPPTAFDVIGGGSYCENDNGLPVDLSGSEINVTYTLYKNEVAQIPTVEGTGSGISFGDQLFGTYTISGTSANGTTEMNGNAIIIEETTLPVSVSVVADQNNICPGTVITFTATPENGGSTSYQWFVNSIAVGDDNSQFSYIPVNEDEVYVEMTSSLGCVTNNPASSNTIVMSVIACQPWNFTITGQVHTINIPTSANPNINGEPLAAGDWIGVFFVDGNGIEQCAGAVQWNLQGSVINAYGNDPTTPEKDGFVANETFKWRMFKTSSSIEYPAGATYDASMPNQGNFADFGLSKLTSLQAMVCQNYAFSTGWNSISSYITPFDASVETMFAPILDELVIMRNLTSVYWPGENLNTIGNFNNQSGYALKVSSNVNFNICGAGYSTKEVSLTPGWSYLPVLSECSANAMDLFGSHLNDIVIIQDLIGTKVFWPAMNVYSLETLEPGKAYKTKVVNPFTITFPACGTKSSSTSISTKNSLSTPWGEIAMTPSAQTIAFTTNALAEMVQGDVIGAFDQNNTLFGYVEIIGNNVVNTITIFGDDATTIEKDGFAEGESISLRLYRTNTGEEFVLEVVYDTNFDNSTGNYLSSSLSALNAVTMGVTGINNPGASGISIYPNPATDFVIINIATGNFAGATVIVNDTKGRTVIEKMIGSSNSKLDISNLRSGVYVINIKSYSINKISKLIVR